MELYNRTSIFLFSLTFVLFTGVNAKILCPRIYFQNIVEDKMPYKFIEGVFVKQSYNHNSFPVYKRENGKLLLYLNTNGNSTLMFGLNFTSYFNVATRLFASVDPVLWLSSGKLNRDDVFQGLSSHWVYWNPRSRTNVTVKRYPRIKAICVDDDFRKCDSDRLYINVDLYDAYGNITNNASTDYFKPWHGNYKNLRPVYKHSSQNWYLQYSSFYGWEIQKRIIKHYSQKEVKYMSVYDFALRPEYITKSWYFLNDFDSWQTARRFSVKIKCRGISSQVNTCSTIPCSNGGTCVYTSGNETLCVCRPGYYGLRCQDDKNKRCPTVVTGWGRTRIFEWLYVGNFIGDIAMTFCRGSSPSVRYAICVYYSFQTPSPHWSKKGTVCRRPPRPTNRRTSKPMNPFIDSAVLISAVLLQILLPFVLWCCTFIKKSCTEDEDRSVLQQYSKKKSIFRVISLVLNISFYVWLSFSLWCQLPQCTNYSDTLGHLQIMAIVMLIICPLVVVTEGLFSSELFYIKNIMLRESALDYIEMLQTVSPVVSMNVTYPRLEVQTRNINYTDSNGNIQSRTETNEKVVKVVDSDVFEFGSWVNKSNMEMSMINPNTMTRLEIYGHVVFGDQETKEDFTRKKQEMLDRHRNTKLSVKKHIPGLDKSPICVYVVSSVQPWWISKEFYWFATLLMLTWPYRWLLRAKTAKTQYVLKKIIYKGTTPPIEVNNASNLQAASMAQQNHSHINHSFSMSESSDPEQSTIQRCPTPPPPYPGIQRSENPPAYHELLAPSTNQGRDFLPYTQEVVPSTPPPCYDEVGDQTPSSTWLA